MTPFDEGGVLGELTAQFPRTGRVDWIGVRGARRAPVSVVASAYAEAGAGLQGDHYKRDGKRQVTLIQAESLPVIASFLGMESDAVSPETLRRNLVVSGINLLALIGWSFRIGDVLLQGMATCPPCSRMEEALGVGAYNAMRGHGGIVAKVIQSGWIHQGAFLQAGSPSQKPGG